MNATTNAVRGTVDGALVCAACGSDPLYCGGCSPVTGDWSHEAEYGTCAVDGAACEHEDDGYCLVCMTYSKAHDVSQPEFYSSRGIDLTLPEVEGMDGEALYYWADVLPRIEASAFVVFRSRGNDTAAAMALSRGIVATYSDSLVMGLRCGVYVSECVANVTGWMAR